jgi:hypothetical protein
MGLFGDSQQEKELKALLEKTYNTMQRLLDDYNTNNQRVTSYGKQCINQFAGEVNLLYSKSANLSVAKQMSIQIYIDRQWVSLYNSKVGFMLFKGDFERTTGERIPIKYN